MYVSNEKTRNTETVYFNPLKMIATHVILVIFSIIQIHMIFMGKACLDMTPCFKGEEIGIMFMEQIAITQE
jgi:hypothetical protein